MYFMCKCVYFMCKCVYCMCKCVYFMCKCVYFMCKCVFLLMRVTEETIYSALHGNHYIAQSQSIITVHDILYIPELKWIYQLL
jgi:hypothetical protein